MNTSNTKDAVSQPMRLDEMVIGLSVVVLLLIASFQGMPNAVNSATKFRIKK
jgi:hypothetical protein